MKFDFNYEWITCAVLDQRPIYIFTCSLRSDNTWLNNTYHGLFIPVVEHWLEREIAVWVHQWDRSDDLQIYKIFLKGYRTIIIYKRGKRQN